MRVALTGGIASGKSTAADELRRLGVAVIDYDELARAVVAPGTKGFDAVVDAFGRDFVAPDGSLDRAGLAAAVFASDKARQRLEDIVHPLVFEAAAEAEAAARGAPLVVHEIPLLVEDMDPADFDEVIVVDAPADLRVDRLVRDRGMARDEAVERIRAQADDASRLAVADVVWDGSGSAAQLRAQVDRWVRLGTGTREGAGMPHPMRLSKREITDFDGIVDVLQRCRIGRIGLADAEGPYVVPVNYGVEVVDGRVVIWCHGAQAGRKVDAIKADGRVCFEADVCQELITDVPVNDMTTVYESVIGFGRAEYVTDRAEMRHGLAVLIDAVAPGRSAEMGDVPHNVAVLKIVLDRVTGKRRPRPDGRPE